MGIGMMVATLRPKTLSKPGSAQICISAVRLAESLCLLAISSFGFKQEAQLPVCNLASVWVSETKCATPTQALQPFVSFHSVEIFDNCESVTNEVQNHDQRCPHSSDCTKISTLADFTMKRLSITLLAVLSLAACATPGQVSVNTPQSHSVNYPPIIEESEARQQSAREAWKRFLSDWRLPEVKLDVSPITGTPRSLPADLAGKINIHNKPGNFGEMEAKEAVRRFVERSLDLFGGQGIGGAFVLKDLSLVSFSDEGNFFRATFWQVSYPFRLADGFGELRLIVGKNGELLQWSSSLIPTVILPTRAEISAQSIYEKLLNREFTYTTIAGRPQSYKIAKRQEIKIGELIVYPKAEGNRMKIHLAFPVVVGSGTTWTVFIDAINGDELEVKQNFAS